MKSDNKSKPGHDRWFSVAISNNWATRWRNSAAGMIDWQAGWMFKARLLGWMGRRGGGGEEGRERESRPLLVGRSAGKAVGDGNRSKMENNVIRLQHRVHLYKLFHVFYIAVLVIVFDIKKKKGKIFYSRPYLEYRIQSKIQTMKYEIK